MAARFTNENWLFLAGKFLIYSMVIFSILYFQKLY
jgi:hypothetical protein